MIVGLIIFMQHNETGSKIGIQLVHFMKLARSGYRQVVEDLTFEEIKALEVALVQAAVRVREAGLRPFVSIVVQSFWRTDLLHHARQP